MQQLFGSPLRGQAFDFSSAEVNWDTAFWPGELLCSSSQQLSLLPLNILWDKQRVLAALRTGFIQCQLLFEQSLKLVIHTEEIFWIADENTRTIPKQLMHTADGF